MADLNEILRAWAADQENVPRTHISNVSYDYEDGFGTEETSEPSVFIVKYTVIREIGHRIEIEDLGDFIGELANTMMRGPIGPPVSEKIPEASLREALRNLVDCVQKDDNHISAVTRLACMAAEKVLRGKDG